MVNVIGEGFYFLFGTLSDSTLSVINEKIDLAGTNGKILLRIANEQASLINITAKNQERHEILLHKISDITKGLAEEHKISKQQESNNIAYIFKGFLCGHFFQSDGKNSIRHPIRNP